MIVSCSIDHATTTDVIVLLAAVDIPRHALLRPFVDSAPLTELRDKPNSIDVTRRAQGNESPFRGGGGMSPSLSKRYLSLRSSRSRQSPR